MKLALAIIVGVLALAHSSDSAAYCVYNRADRSASFSSFGGPNFSKDVAAGGKECCPYTERTCNAGKKKTSKVQMATYIQTDSVNYGIGAHTSGYTCGKYMSGGFKEGEGWGYYVEGGGWAELHKDGSGYSVRVYNADRSLREKVACTYSK
jgi:hypothetical protein